MASTYSERVLNQKNQLMKKPTMTKKQYETIMTIYMVMALILIALPFALVFALVYLTLKH